MHTGLLVQLLVEPEPRSTAPSPEKVTALPMWYLHNPGMQSCHGKKPISGLLGAPMHAVRNQHYSHLKVNSSSLGVGGLPCTSASPSALSRGLLIGRLEISSTMLLHP